MPYPFTNIHPSEIKLFYQLYDEKNSKPDDAILFNSISSQKFAQDILDDLVDKNLWDETSKQQLENKQLYFKVFREDEDIIPIDAILFENVRLLPNQGLLSLERTLQNTWNSSLSWLSGLVPVWIKQGEQDFGNFISQWTEDKLTGLSAYSSDPKIKKMDEEKWREIVRENSAGEDQLDAEEIETWADPAKFSRDLLGFARSLSPNALIGDSTQPTKDTTADFSLKSFAESLINSVWNFAYYTYSNPFKTLTLALAAYATANTIYLPKNKFETEQQLSNGINTATNVFVKLALAQVATRGSSNIPLSAMVTGMSLWSGVVATTPEVLISGGPYSTNAAIAKISGGRFVIAWEDCCGQDGSGALTRAGIFNATTGEKIGLEFQVNNYTLGNQGIPNVAELVNGNFIVTFASQYEGIRYKGFAQIFNATGGKVGSEFQITNSSLSIDNFTFRILSLSNGNFVIVWQSGSAQGFAQDGSGWGIRGELFNVTGERIRMEFPVNTFTTLDQVRPAIAALPNDGFVVVWEGAGNQDGSGIGIFMQGFNKTGDKKGLEIQVNTNTTGDQDSPRITSFSNGNFVIVWNSGKDIFLQLYNASSVKVRSEMRVNTYTENTQTKPKVAAFSNGSFIVIWESVGQDGSGSGVYGQRFDALGKKIGTEFQINIQTTGEQYHLAIATLDDDSFVVAWESWAGSATKIYARIFTPPQLLNNTLYINQGQTKILTGVELSASAPKIYPGTLIFTPINVTHGDFKLASNPSLTIFNFTQQQVIDGQIQFVHDGSIFAPSYYVKVNEVMLDTTPTPANIIFITPSPTPTPTLTASPTPSETPSPSASSTPSPSALPSLSPTPTATPSVSSTPTPSTSVTSTPSVSPSPSPLPTTLLSPSQSPTALPSPSLSPTVSSRSKTTPSNQKRDQENVNIIIGVSVAIFIISLLSMLGTILYKKRKQDLKKEGARAEGLRVFFQQQTIKAIEQSRKEKESVKQKEQPVLIDLQPITSIETPMESLIKKSILVKGEGNCLFDAIACSSQHSKVDDFLTELEKSKINLFELIKVSNESNLDTTGVKSAVLNFFDSIGGGDDKTFDEITFLKTLQGGMTGEAFKTKMRLNRFASPEIIKYVETLYHRPIVVLNSDHQIIGREKLTQDNISQALIIYFDGKQYRAFASNSETLSVLFSNLSFSGKFKEVVSLESSNISTIPLLSHSATSPAKISTQRDSFFSNSDIKTIPLAKQEKTQPAIKIEPAIIPDGLVLKHIGGVDCGIFEAVAASLECSPDELKSTIEEKLEHYKTLSSEEAEPYNKILGETLSANIADNLRENIFLEPRMIQLLEVFLYRSIVIINSNGKINGLEKKELPIFIYHAGKNYSAFCLKQGWYPNQVLEELQKKSAPLSVDFSPHTSSFRPS
jgi:hypothetical protein